MLETPATVERRLSMADEAEFKNKADFKIREDALVSRRNFIKGVITSGVAVSSASYLFRASTLLSGQQVAAGVGERLITLNVNGQQRRVDVIDRKSTRLNSSHLG